MTDWESEKSFWENPSRPTTYDIEECGSAYSSYRTMVAQKRREFYHGDWVMSADYRRDVEALEALVTLLSGVLKAQSDETT